MPPILNGKQDVSGLVAVKPRPTLAGVGYGLLYLVLPVGLVGAALDLAVQVLFRVCVGFWCVL